MGGSFGAATHTRNQRKPAPAGISTSARTGKAPALGCEDGGHAATLHPEASDGQATGRGRATGLGLGHGLGPGPGDEPALTLAGQEHAVAYRDEARGDTWVAEGLGVEGADRDGVRTLVARIGNAAAPEGIVDRDQAARS